MGHKELRRVLSERGREGKKERENGAGGTGERQRGGNRERACC